MAKYSVYQDTDTTGRARYGITLSIDGATVRTIPDISVDHGEIDRLTQVFNEEALDPVHLDQAVEDFLIDRRIPE